MNKIYNGKFRCQYCHELYTEEAGMKECQEYCRGDREDIKLIPEEIPEIGDKAK